MYSGLSFHAYLSRRRKSIDVLKEMFRDELSKDDWRLVIKLKKVGNWWVQVVLGSWEVGAAAVLLLR